MQIQLKSAVGEIITFIKRGEPLTNNNLIEICRSHKIELIGKQNETHLIHELLETAINLSIVESFNRADLLQDERAKQTLEGLNKLLEKCPPRSWRDEELIRLQQFSTPPTIAYLMAKLLKPSKKHLILEPSAGTGSLAAWLKVAVCRVRTNELSATRRLLLEVQGYAATGVNAEFLNDLLPEEVQPDGVLMNPPFSLSGGRTKTNDSNFGFRHIFSALSRLKAGGRLIALVGTEGGTRTGKARKFWSGIAAEYDLRAIIHLPKNAFYKYGTSIGTSIICIVKSDQPNGANRNAKSKNISEVSCETLEECLKYTDIFN